MEISGDKNPALKKSTNMQGERKFGQNRRALSEINQNLGGAQFYPCVVNKRTSSQKLSEQIANKKQCFPEENKKSKSTSDENFSVWEDCTITDVVEDQPVPMFFETSESVLDQKDHHPEEVEMEDIFEESVVDIDISDAKNPLAVVEYVDDLYAHYRKMESFSLVSLDYMTQQFDINARMRAILIDWLIEVHHKFDLRHETLFLTVNLIDRFLAKQCAVRKNLQLVGLVGMLLACKYEEVSVPVIDDLVFISDKAYLRSQILEMEKLMLNTLQFNMWLPTPYVFMKRFLKAAQSDLKLDQMSFFLIELCLVEYETIKYPPSFLAAAAIYTAQCSLYGLNQWSKTCEWHTKYSEEQLLECSRMIVGYHQKSTTGRLTGVHRKYNTPKYGYAAKCEAAKFLVESTTNQDI